MEHGPKGIISVWITLSLLYCTCNTSELFDAALHKDCSQLSTYEGYVAEGAVDGIIDSLTTCSHTSNGSNLWWRVDLGGVYWVHSVLVRNRGDGIGVSDRLRDFTISVSMDGSGQGTKCASYEGAMPNGAVETLPCGHDILGRFVKISKPSIDWLTLCEVQVLVNGRPKVVFERQIKKAIVTDFHSEKVVADVRSCAEFCKTFLGCQAFGFNPTTRTCRQYRTTMLSNTTSDEWIYFTNIY